MRNLVFLVIVTTGVGLLSACGQKGPLVLPARPAASAPAAAGTTAPASTAASAAAPVSSVR